MIALARSRAEAAGPGRMTVVEADYLAYPVADSSFDFACANTSLHHMDFTAALAAMAGALRPGGRLAVIGLAAHGSFGDYLAYRAVRGKGDPAAACLPRQGRPVRDCRAGSAGWAARSAPVSPTLEQMGTFPSTARKLRKTLRYLATAPTSVTRR